METEEKEIAEAIQEVKPEKTEPEIIQNPIGTDQELAKNYENVTDFCFKKLIEKRKAGKNLTMKSEKVQICKEIQADAQRIFGSCSYQLVESQVKKALKTDLQENDTVSTEGNAIIKKPVKTLERPEKKIVTEEDQKAQTNIAPSEKAKIILNAKTGEPTPEEMIIGFTLQDAADFITVLGMPRPQNKRLMMLAKRISIYNQIQVANGHPEKQMDIPESLMKWALYLGIITTFVKPAVDKWFTSSKDKKTSKESRESLV